VRRSTERVAVIELEQTGDSAKAAVEADPGVSPATLDAVLEAHLAICVAKGKLDLLFPKGRERQHELPSLYRRIGTARFAPTRARCR
jgi:hypothetical protein